MRKGTGLGVLMAGVENTDVAGVTGASPSSVSYWSVGKHIPHFVLNENEKDQPTQWVEDEDGKRITNELQKLTAILGCTPEQLAQACMEIITGADWKIGRRENAVALPAMNPIHWMILTQAATQAMAKSQAARAVEIDPFDFMDAAQAIEADTLLKVGEIAAKGTPEILDPDNTELIKTLAGRRSPIKGTASSQSKPQAKSRVRQKMSQKKVERKA